MPRLPALDGLRGVAILLVFSLHCFNWPQGGHLGVDLFFLLSGFLITSLLLDERTSTGTISLRRFYRRRGARLFPALAVFLAVYMVIAAGKGIDALPAAALGAFYVSNIVEAFGSTHILFNDGIPHLWTLAQEEQFYLVWPLMLPFVLKRRRPVRLLVLFTVALVVYRIGLALLGATHARLYNGPDTHMDGLVLGAAIAFLMRARPNFRLRPIWLSLALPFVMEALLVRAPATSWDAFGLPIAEAALVAVLLGALTLPAFAAVLAIRPLRFFGRISYSLYLWHFTLAWAWGLPHHAWAAAALSVSIAYVSTRWLEEPLRARWRESRPEAMKMIAPATT